MRNTIYLITGNYQALHILAKFLDPHHAGSRTRTSPFPPMRSTKAPLGSACTACTQSYALASSASSLTVIHSSFSCCDCCAASKERLRNTADRLYPINTNHAQRMSRVLQCMNSYTYPSAAELGRALKISNAETIEFEIQTTQLAVRPSQPCSILHSAWCVASGLYQGRSDISTACGCDLIIQDNRWCLTVAC